MSLILTSKKSPQRYSGLQFSLAQLVSTAAAAQLFFLRGVGGGGEEEEDKPRRRRRAAALSTQIATLFGLRLRPRFSGGRARGGGPTTQLGPICPINRTGRQEGDSRERPMNRARSTLARSRLVLSEMAQGAGGAYFGRSFLQSTSQLSKVQPISDDGRPI